MLRTFPRFFSKFVYILYYKSDGVEQGPLFAAWTIHVQHEKVFRENARITPQFSCSVDIAEAFKVLPVKKICHALPSSHLCMMGDSYIYLPCLWLNQLLEIRRLVFHWINKIFYIRKHVGRLPLLVITSGIRYFQRLVVDGSQSRQLKNTRSKVGIDSAFAYGCEPMCFVNM